LRRPRGKRTGHPHRIWRSLPHAGDILAGTSGATLLNGTGGRQHHLTAMARDTIGGVRARHDHHRRCGSTALIRSMCLPRRNVRTPSWAQRRANCKRGDVLDFTAIANLTDSVATGQTLTTNFAPTTCSSSTARRDECRCRQRNRCDVSVVGRTLYRIADQANHNAVTGVPLDRPGGMARRKRRSHSVGRDINNLTRQTF